MQNEPIRPRWSLRRGLVALIVFLVISPALYSAFGLAHFQGPIAKVLSATLALGITFWLIRFDDRSKGVDGRAEPVSSR